MLRAIERRQTLFLLVFALTALLGFQLIQVMPAHYVAVGQLRISHLEDLPPDQRTAEDMSSGEVFACAPMRYLPPRDLALNLESKSYRDAVHDRAGPAGYLASYEVAAIEPYGRLQITATGSCSEQTLAIIGALVDEWNERLRKLSLTGHEKAVEFLRLRLANVDGRLANHRSGISNQRLMLERRILVIHLREVELGLKTLASREDHLVFPPHVRRVGSDPRMIVALVLALAALAAMGGVLVADRQAS